MIAAHDLFKLIDRASERASKGDFHEFTDQEAHRVCDAFIDLIKMHPVAMRYLNHRDRYGARDDQPWHAYGQWLFAMMEIACREVPILIGSTDYAPTSDKASSGKGLRRR